jgi:hypothetical protein
MDDQAPHLDFLLNLDGQHDELLVRLEELDKRVAKVLAECQAMRERLTPAADPASPTC